MGLDKGFQLTVGGDLTSLHAPMLEETGVVDHAFSTRMGGYSGGTMASLNTAFHTGDDYRLVLGNRRKFLATRGYDPAEVISVIQVHGTGIIPVTGRDTGKGAIPNSAVGEGDALVTSSPGVVITAYAADCLLLFLAAPRVPVIALAHAGWRGTAENMALAVVNFLRECRADLPEILAAISPGICAGCYQVDEKVAESFRRAGWEDEPYLKRSKGAYNLDLARINAAQLLQAGIKKENLAENRWCTSCRPDLFYSYRRDKGVTGRMMGFMAIRKDK